MNAPNTHERASARRALRDNLLACATKMKHGQIAPQVQAVADVLKHYGPIRMGVAA